MTTRPSRILLTGATGYVGGRLLSRLLGEGFTVRALVRRPDEFLGDSRSGLEVLRGDLLQPFSLPRAMDDVQTAFYLVHSMGVGDEFAEMDRQAARNFGRAARNAGVQHIVYLGGLGDSREDLSLHLESRQEVGEILRSTGIPTTEFRASIVLGAGSLSFEMIRALTERLPVMITPRWVEVRAQPIAIDDLLEYLMVAITRTPDASRVIEVGGKDTVSYGGLMKEYARQRGLRRWMIRVPFLTPRLSSLWLGLVTPLYARVGRKLIESIRNPTIVGDPEPAKEFPVEPMGVEEAIRRAMADHEESGSETNWSGAVSSSGLRPPEENGPYKGRIVDERSIQVTAAPDQAFRPISEIGGRNGWYAFNGLWKVRGLLDTLVGGVGLRRGRPASGELRPGSALDFWRVEAWSPPRLLRLRAEMKLPGRAWLEFSVEPSGAGSLLTQRAIFDPKGLFGLLYWYSLFPIHVVIFRAMLREIRRRGEEHPPHHPGSSYDWPGGHQPDPG